jgi:hypothetical protein
MIGLFVIACSPAIQMIDRLVGRQPKISSLTKLTADQSVDYLSLDRSVG